ncbi:hypothetical protein HAQ01_04725 [Acidithiobacillus thiooxidans]|uniref:Uncharacterized protein n=1 Tax=Acidithiobacillus sulfurivorans TaxID=1958756 RepID=A0ABS5ZYI3_9PROT|nr:MULTISPECIES: hypothetical protein [Acidithiobacillus]MBU2760292.1 hypothetical protein [Acidithiobacillus sulfurivorans]MBU2792725.1 hypothetical protein [Acidithiobacillus thiooxidans]
MKKVAPIDLLRKPDRKYPLIQQAVYFYTDRANNDIFSNWMFLVALLSMYSIVIRPRIRAQVEAMEARKAREAQEAWETWEA